jgi:hypothetical protein
MNDKENTITSKKTQAETEKETETENPSTFIKLKALLDDKNVTYKLMEVIIKHEYTYLFKLYTINLISTNLPKQAKKLRLSGIHL